MDPLAALDQIMQLPGVQRIQRAYAECTEAADQSSSTFRSTLLRWLSDEQLQHNDKSMLALAMGGDEKSTLLHWAAMTGDLVSVEALLKHGANRHLRSNGMTPADIALEHEQAHLLEREGSGLLYDGADGELDGNEIASILEEGGDLASVMQWFVRGGSPDMLLRHGETHGGGRGERAPRREWLERVDRSRGARALSCNGGKGRSQAGWIGIARRWCGGRREDA
jgi:hypothetical protein